MWQARDKHSGHMIGAYDRLHAESHRHQTQQGILRGWSGLKSVKAVMGQTSREAVRAHIGQSSLAVSRPRSGAHPR